MLMNQENELQIYSYTFSPLTTFMVYEQGHVITVLAIHALVFRIGRCDRGWDWVGCRSVVWIQGLTQEDQTRSLS